MAVKVDAHSELMTAYPWGFSGVTPNASDNLPDHGTFDGNSLVFTDDGSIGSGAPDHNYTALVASTMKPQSGTADPAMSTNGFRGPQPGKACTADDGTSPPSACDDGPFGKGAGGELVYSVTVPSHDSKTLWIAAAGSDQSTGDAQTAAVQRAFGPRRGAAEQDRFARAHRELHPGFAARGPSAAERDHVGQAEPRRPHADGVEPADSLDQSGKAVPAATRHSRTRALVRSGVPRLSVDVRHRR